MEPAEANVKSHTGTTPPLNVLVHRVVEVLSTKVTVPVGTAVPANVGATTAVKATCWLTVEEAGVDERVAVVPEADTIRAEVRLDDPVEKF